MRFIFGLLALAFGLMILWAVGAGDFGAAGAWLTSRPWGIVTLTDLYLGLFVSAVVIFFVEGRSARGVLWCLPLPVLGNVWTLFWLALRWPRLRELLARR